MCAHTYIHTYTQTSPPHPRKIIKLHAKCSTIDTNVIRTRNGFPHKKSHSREDAASVLTGLVNVVNKILQDPRGQSCQHI